MAVGEWQQHAPRTGVHNRRTSWGRGARSAVGSVRGHRPCRAYPRGSLLEEYAHSQESMWGFLWVVVARQAHSAPHFSFTPRLARRTRSKAWVRARCSAAVKRGDVPHFGVDSQCRGGRTSWDGSRGGAAQTGGEDRGPPMNIRPPRIGPQPCGRPRVWSPAPSRLPPLLGWLRRLPGRRLEVSGGGTAGS